MCTAKTPKIETVETETIATPTVADAATSKNAKKNVQKTAQNSGRDVRTSNRGDESEANTKKKKLLGE